MNLVSATLCVLFCLCYLEIYPTEATVCVPYTRFRIDCNSCICSSEGTKYSCSKYRCHGKKKMSIDNVGEEDFGFLADDNNLGDHRKAIPKFSRKYVHKNRPYLNDMIDPVDAIYDNDDSPQSEENNNNNNFKEDDNNDWLSEPETKRKSDFDDNYIQDVDLETMDVDENIGHLPNDYRF